jgi:DNA-directed RNA polymerase subunit RPC12/RpoP
MARPTSPKPPRAVRTTFAPGVYLSCAACGRLLKIGWATRSIVCSCGARITPPVAEKTAEKKADEGSGG